MDQLLRSDEPGALNQPIVAIPRRWSLWLSLLGLIPTIPLAVLSWLDSEMALRRQRPGLDGWIGWFAPFWAVTLVLVIGVAAAIWMRGVPAFAVFKDGLKVDFRRVAPWRSFRDPWSYGFYAWGEVDYCRWSPYKPGVLSVHVGAAEQHPPPGWLGELPAAMIKVPPGVFFHRVPEHLRTAVESAIRTYGKWVD